MLFRFDFNAVFVNKVSRYIDVRLVVHLNGVCSAYIQRIITGGKVTVKGRDYALEFLIYYRILIIGLTACRRFFRILDCNI